MLCSIIPDLDVISFKLGIAYASEYGHRGFSHSLVFAAVLASVLCLFSKQLYSDRLNVWLFCFIGAASHGVLDAFTNGGLGVAFYWPFDDARYFFTQGVIEVSPIGVTRFLSERGMAVLQSEFRWVWLPCTFVVAGFYTLKSFFK